MRTILVIREFDEFSRILKASDFKIINLPLIETKALENLSDLEARLSKIENYDGIFVTSRQAAQVLSDKMREKDLNFSGRVYVLGGRSFEILKGLNLELVFDGAANTALEMLDKIPTVELKDKRFLFVRGEKSLRVVPDFLSKIASVDETIVYDTRKIAGEVDKINEIREKIETGEIVATCFFSPSGAEIFLEQFGAEITHQTIIAAIGKTTAGYFERLNLKVGFVSSKSSAEGFAIDFAAFLTNGKREMENRK